MLLSKQLQESRSLFLATSTPPILVWGGVGPYGGDGALKQDVVTFVTIIVSTARWVLERSWQILNFIIHVSFI